MQHLTFSNNDEMPALGLGTWKSEPKEVYRAVKTAIKTGYRHIDCAFIYGNEKEVGQAIKDCIQEGIVSREELWITSKLWNNSHASNAVVPAIKKTLKDLQLKYLDLYLIHWPVALQANSLYAEKASDFMPLKFIPLEQTWQGMQDAKEQGLAKHIGVSNFGIQNLTKLIESAKIKPEMNQVELHPYLQQDELVSFCHDNDIHLTAYSPLGSGDRPDSLKRADETKLLDDPIIAKIAKQKEATPAQVLISWSLHRGIAVIPKSVNAGRIQENFEAKDIQLTDEEMQQIKEVNKDFRYVDGSFWVVDGGPYTIDDIWK